MSTASTVMCSDFARLMRSLTPAAIEIPVHPGENEAMIIPVKNKKAGGVRVNPGFLGFLLCIAVLVFTAGCGESSDSGTSTGSTSASTSTSNTSQDRAARLAAQSQLRNAQMAQEEYYVENERYAGTAAELKTIDEKLNPKLEVISGGARGYEMKITANDSSQTVYILRQTESRIERVDGEGNPW